MTSPNGLLLSDDLMFASRVTATAEAHGFLIEQFRDPVDLIARAVATSSACVFVDLQVAGPKLEQIVGKLATLSPRPRIVAFGSHVAIKALNAARDAGCDVVVPRSAFADQLEVELPRWLSCPS